MISVIAAEFFFPTQGLFPPFVLSADFPIISLFQVENEAGAQMHCHPLI